MKSRGNAVVAAAVVAVMLMASATAVMASAAAARKPADRTVHISLVSCGGQGVACTNRTEEALVTIKSSALSTLRHRGSKPLAPGERVYGLRFHLIADEMCTPGLVAGVEQLYSDLIASGVTPSHFGYDFYPIDAVQPAHDDAGSGKKPDFRRLESNKPCAGQKLLVPYILPHTLDAVINLDTDLVIVESLGKLWDKFDSYNTTQWIGLCPEHAVANIAWYGRLSRHPFYPPYGLNSGVLPMNLTRIRHFDLTPDLSDPPGGKAERKRTRKLIADGREPEVSLSRKYRADPYPLQALFSALNTQYYEQVVWGDQDLLNIFTHDHRHLLSLIECAWNYRPDHCQYGHNCKVTAQSSPATAKADGEIVSILHGNRQVYHNGNMLPFRNIYDFIRDYNFHPKSKAAEALLKRTEKGNAIPNQPPGVDLEECKKVMSGVLKQLVPKVSAWAADDTDSGDSNANTATRAATAADEDDEDDADKGLHTMKGVSDDEGASGDDDPRLWGGEEEEDKAAAAKAKAAAPNPAAAAAAPAAATKKSAAERAHDDDDDSGDEDEAPSGPAVMRLPYEFLEGDALASAEAAALADTMMHVFMIYTNYNPNRHKQFVTSVESIFDTTPMTLAQPVTLHFCIDPSSADRVKEVVTALAARVNAKEKAAAGATKAVDFKLYQIGDIERKLSGLKPLFTKLEQFFTSGGHVGGSIFFLGPLLHIVLPGVHRALQLDADIKVKTNLRTLWNRFDKYGPETLMGLAYDQQPVYRHVMWKWRQQNPGTKIGNPPATGFAGYNSGVMLMHLDRMRGRRYASTILNSTYVDVLTSKYSFKGHLGDQDWLTLVSAEKDNRGLFHLLPCQWNRQLCEYWKTGYAEVWDDYHGCSAPIHLWHGNCNTPFPDGE